MQDRSTSQASDSCADDTDMRWIMLGSTMSADDGSAGIIENGICNARAIGYLLPISESHAKVFCVYSWVIDINSSAAPAQQWKWGVKYPFVWGNYAF
jgi:hypothetical protein